VPNACILEENCELRNVVSQVKAGACDVSCGYCFINELVNIAANIIRRRIDSDNKPPIQRYKINKKESC
jgi:hypothetical protein